MKPSTCFYSGFYLIRYMKGVRSNKDKLESFKSNFCDKYKTALPQRTEFVQALRKLTGDDFDNECST